MGRNRKPEDRWMPLRVYRGRTQYELHPKDGSAVMLCPITSTNAEVWEAYERVIAKTTPTMENIAAGYFTSRQFLRRRPSTQDQYRDAWASLKKVWGKVQDASKVKQKHVRAWMDKRGEKGEVAANRELSVLSNIFAYAFERSIVPSNPCQGVKKFPEEAREKYIEDDEYYPYLSASKKAVQVAMEISYCCGARGQDVRSITMADLRDDGIFIRQGKTGKKQIKKWSPRLEDAVELAKTLRAEILENVPGVLSPYLIVTQTGQPYTASGFKTLWQKNKQEVQATLNVKIDWTYHDIKAKGISDYDGDKMKFGGHKTVKQMQDYDRRTQLAPTIDSHVRPLAKK